MVQAVKYLLKMLYRAFDSRNITTPLNMLRKAVIPSKRTRDLEAIWAKSKVKESLIKQMFKKVKSFIFVIASFALTLVLSFLYRRKEAALAAKENE